LNRTLRDGQTEIAARRFDRDRWVWARGSLAVVARRRWRFTQPANTTSKNCSGATDIFGDPTYRLGYLPRARYERNEEAEDLEDPD
jgi:hypothetical protein